MKDPFCEECLMRHDVCSRCGAYIVACLRLHINMNAHGNGKHFCGSENPGYQAMIRAMREDADASRDLLTSCPTCQDDVIRRANSPVLYDVHGFYGLLGDSAVHQCSAVAADPTPIRRSPSIERPAQPALAEVGMEIPR